MLIGPLASLIWLDLDGCIHSEGGTQQRRFPRSYQMPIQLAYQTSHTQRGLEAPQAAPQASPIGLRPSIDRGSYKLYRKFRFWLPTEYPACLADLPPLLTVRVCCSLWVYARSSSATPIPRATLCLVSSHKP